MNFICVGDYSVSLAFPVTKGLGVHPSSYVGLQFVGVLQAIVKVLCPVRFPAAIRARMVEEEFVVSIASVECNLVEPRVDVENRFIRSSDVLTLPFKLLLHRC